MTSSSFPEERLFNQLRLLLGSSWYRRFDLQDAREWLSQFEDHEDPEQSERFQALFLLSQFMFFGEHEIKALLRALYRDLIEYPIIEAARRANGDTRDVSLLAAALNEELRGTRFVGLGNPSESSTHLLYYFRQENGLPLSMFMGPDQVFLWARDGESFAKAIRDDSVHRYVVIDDLCGSGRQAKRYAEEFALPLAEMARQAGLDVQISYMALFATTEGLTELRDLGAFDRAETVVELDPSFRCFHEESRFFKNEQPPVSKPRSEAMSRRMGELLSPEHPLGYDDSQLLMGFAHNTPDNTLPIFSFDEPDGPAWMPLFKRYAKVDA